MKQLRFIQILPYLVTVISSCRDSLCIIVFSIIHYIIIRLYIVFIITNNQEYDAVACAAAEGHDSILQYLLSQVQSPNGSCKVNDTDSSCMCVPLYVHVYNTIKVVLCYCIRSYCVSCLCMMWSGLFGTCAYNICCLLMSCM